MSRVAKPTFVFISHAKEDAEAASEIDSLIRPMGFRAWRFQDDMPPGSQWEQANLEGIDSCDIFLFLVTKHSLKSCMCDKECQHAALTQRPIAIANLQQDVLPPSPLNSIQCVLYDKSPRSGVELTVALQDCDPLPIEAIPDHWTTWHGKTKHDLALKHTNTLAKETQPISQVLSPVRIHDYLLDTLTDIKIYFDNELRTRQQSDTRIQAGVRKNHSSSFSCFLSVDAAFRNVCRIYLNPEANSIELDGSIRNVLHWEVREIKRVITDKKFQIERNLQSVINGDKAAAELVRNLDTQVAALWSEHDHWKSALDRFEHSQGNVNLAENRISLALVARSDGTPAYKLSTRSLGQSANGEKQVIANSEVARILFNYFMNN